MYIYSSTPFFLLYYIYSTISKIFVWLLTCSYNTNCTCIHACTGRVLYIYFTGKIGKASISLNPKFKIAMYIHVYSNYLATDKHVFFHNGNYKICLQVLFCFIWLSLPERNRVEDRGEFSMRCQG